jgi:hypothetical protein
MKISKDFEKLLADRGVSLEDLGLQDIALRRNDAIRAIQLLLRDSIPVLGGDVYYHEDSRNSIAYANWYCEPEGGENVAAFATRSCKRASEYINRFPELEGREPVFALVVKK